MTRTLFLSFRIQAVAYLLITCFLSAACNSPQESSEKAISQQENQSSPVSSPSQPALPPKAGNDTAIEVLNAEEILLNGKLKRYFSIAQFRSLLGTPDSSRLLSEEQPCNTIFEEADGSVDPKATYLYKNGSRYENTQDKVAIDEVSFTHGDFIVYHGMMLNARTTVDDLRKLFPNAVKHIGIMDVNGNGELQVIQLREDNNNISDGHIRLFLKDGRLYSMHWWFPC